MRGSLGRVGSTTHVRSNSIALQDMVLGVFEMTEVVLHDRMLIQQMCFDGRLDTNDPRKWGGPCVLYFFFHVRELLRHSTHVFFNGFTRC